MIRFYILAPGAHEFLRAQNVSLYILHSELEMTFFTLAIDCKVMKKEKVEKLLSCMVNYLVEI